MSLFKQLIKGIRDIHATGIVHRDLKPENIFVNPHTNVLKIGDFGLARFIEAKVHQAHQAAAAAAAAAIYFPPESSTLLTSSPPPPPPFSSSSSTHPTTTTTPYPPLPPSASTTATTTACCGGVVAGSMARTDSQASVLGEVIGTPGYTAPEGGAFCDEKADIYSAGLILLELLCPRFETIMERYETLGLFRSSHKVPEFIRVNLQPWYMLLKRMGRPNPSDRPSATEVYRNVKAILVPVIIESAQADEEYDEL
eukprot:GHVS01017647.1.p1 GENE.GHVS01017647.1~~GHVS01017647.1.p1  ORF type:complete len:254 (+),score=65.42 GHVS01017647.1:2-763(+)